MAETWYEQGLEQGRAEGQLRTLIYFLQRRFGALSESARDKLERVSSDELDRIQRKTLDAGTLKELGLD